MPNNFPGGPKGAMINPSNDNRHNQVDLNRGGSPRPDFVKRIPPASRGGFGQNGQRVAVRAPMPAGRGGTGNPASRGGAAIGSMSPDRRVPGHGGSPQHGDRMQAKPRGGGFGVPPTQNAHAPGNVRDYAPSNPAPSAGNTSGRSYRLIAGRFKRAAMGARPSAGNSGKYGSPPITSNT
jgi:hypothetical protein